MTFVVTQNCCNDASCIEVCPVDCIRPAPTDPAFGLAEMVYIDPDTCIDCGACQDACPVDAVYADHELPDRLLPYMDLNARYFEQFPLDVADYGADDRPRGSGALPPLSVAVVGSGPAGMYAAQELLDGAPKGAMSVTMIDRLPTPWGLIRAGVAPDHQSTKKVVDVFAEVTTHPQFEFVLNTEVGRDISHEQLASRYDAVIYAVGAQQDRSLGVTGEDLPGVIGAAAFVGWYNGHPDYSDLTPDLSSSRAVVVGNGNVALDVARLLLSAPDDLASTDIADHALDALRQSNVREVVVLGRRGPADAAFTSPELLALGHLRDVDVVIEPEGAADLVVGLGPEVSFEMQHKAQLIRDLAERPVTEGNRRLVLRFLASPTRFIGTDRLVGVDVVNNEQVDVDGARSYRSTGDAETIDAGLLITSVGYRGAPIPGLPFDDAAGILPNDAGRVMDPSTREPVPGVYATGWIKRGPNGGIGANGRCARATVAVLLEDAREGRLPLRPPGTAPGGLRDLVAEAGIPTTGAEGWARIDQFERESGAASQRPRVKVTRLEDLLWRARADEAHSVRNGIATSNVTT